MLVGLDTLLSAHTRADIEQHWPTRWRRRRYSDTYPSTSEDSRFARALAARPRLAAYTATWPAVVDVRAVLATHACRRLPHVLAFVARAAANGCVRDRRSASATDENAERAAADDDDDASVKRLVCEAAARGDALALELALATLAPSCALVTAALHVHAALGHAPELGRACARGAGCFDCAVEPSYARRYARAAAEPDAVRDSGACVVALLAAGADVHARYELALRAAAEAGALVTVVALLAAGARVTELGGAARRRTRDDAIATLLERT